MIYKESKQIGAMINPYHKQFIHSKYDIENWHSVKGNPKKIEKLEIATNEKEKLLGLMTTFITNEIKGKYSQRLFDLLMQFRGSDIENRTLNKAKDEFEKIGLIINRIEKIKKDVRLRLLN